MQTMSLSICIHALHCTLNVQPSNTGATSRELHRQRQPSSPQVLGDLIDEALQGWVGGLCCQLTTPRQSDQQLTFPDCLQHRLAIVVTAMMYMLFQGAHYGHRGTPMMLHGPDQLGLHGTWLATSVCPCSESDAILTSSHIPPPLLIHWASS